jgi:hypothetical protein
MPFQIFISHAEEDQALVDRIYTILWRMGLDPYIYERYPEYGGRNLDDIIREKISECKHLLALLTWYGVQSQWFNQEIGVAYALGRNIIPIVQIGVESKGFIGFKVHIPYNPDFVDDAIYRLIYRLRNLMNPSQVRCRCKNCGKEFLYPLPEQEVVNEVIEHIEEGVILFVECEHCKAEIVLNPWTFEVI